MELATCTSGKAWRFKNNIFFQSTLNLFHQDRIKLYPASITTALFLCGRSLGAAVQICPQLKAFCTSWNAKQDKEDPEQLESYVKQERKTFSSTGAATGVSVLSHLQTDVQRGEMLHSGKQAPFPSFFGVEVITGPERVFVQNRLRELQKY